MQGGTAFAAASALTGPALLDWAKAWAQAAPWKPEKGAKINLMRWRRFVQAEDEAFVKMINAFKQATGVDVVVTNESFEDIQPKASVVANTGQGLDMVWGLYSLPHLFPAKCMDLTDVANYLGKKYGGWTPAAEAYGKSGNKWIGIPVATTGGLMNYRISSMEKAGFKEFPKDTAAFLELVQGAEEEQHAGRLRARSRLGRRQHLAALGAVGARRQPGRQERQGHHQLAGDREGARIRQGAATRPSSPARRRGTTRSNNKIFVAGDLHLTSNGISIYVTAQKENKAVADDMNHAYMPIGPVGKPTELHLAFPILTFQFTKAPQACKALSAFMLEAENFNPWVEAAQGYLSHFLLAYDKNPVWTADPKRTPYRDVVQAHADARRPGLARREGGGGDRRLHRGRHVRQLRDRPRGRQGRHRGGRAAGEAHLSLRQRTTGGRLTAGRRILLSLRWSERPHGRRLDPVTAAQRSAEISAWSRLKSNRQLARLLVHAAGAGDPDPVPRLSARARRLAVVHRRQDRPRRRVHRPRELRVAAGRLRSSGSRSSTRCSTRSSPASSNSARASISRCCSTSICRSRRSIRAAILIPFIVPTVLSAIAFWWIYDTQFSIISWSLRKLGLIATNIDFLGDP